MLFLVDVCAGARVGATRDARRTNSSQGGARPERHGTSPMKKKTALVVLAAALLTPPVVLATPQEVTTRADGRLDDLGRVELEEALIRSERTAVLVGELIRAGVVPRRGAVAGNAGRRGDRP